MTNLLRRFEYSPTGEVLVALGRIPYNLIRTILGLFLAIGTDRTASLFTLAAVVLVLTWGPGPVGVLLATYGILAFFQSATQAFLR